MKVKILALSLGALLLGSVGMVSADDDRNGRRHRGSEYQERHLGGDQYRHQPHRGQGHGRDQWRGPSHGAWGRHQHGHGNGYGHGYGGHGHGHWKHGHQPRPHFGHWGHGGYHDDGVTIIFKGRIN